MEYHTAVRKEGIIATRKKGINFTGAMWTKRKHPDPELHKQKSSMMTEVEISVIS